MRQGKNISTAPTVEPWHVPFVIAARAKRYAGNFLAFEILEHCFYSGWFRVIRWGLFYGSQEN